MIGGAPHPTSSPTTRERSHGLLPNWMLELETRNSSAQSSPKGHARTTDRMRLRLLIPRAQNDHFAPSKPDCQAAGEMGGISSLSCRPMKQNRPAGLSLANPAGHVAVGLLTSRLHQADLLIAFQTNRNNGPNREWLDAAPGYSGGAVPELHRSSLVIGSCSTTAESPSLSLPYGSGKRPSRGVGSTVGGQDLGPFQAAPPLTCQPGNVTEQRGHATGRQFLGISTTAEIPLQR